MIDRNVRTGIVRAAHGLLFTLISASAVTATSERVASYRIEVGLHPTPKAVVEARLAVDGDRLGMAMWGGIDHLPDQWTTFVRDLRVEDSDGRPLRVEPLGPEGWRLLDPAEGSVHVRYEVDLAFTLEPWPPGNEQAGLATDDALYLVTKPLFVTTDRPGPIEVTFDVPDDWTISTPWEAIGRRTFLAVDRDDLRENTVVLGHHAEYEFEEGPFTLTLAMLGPLAEERELLATSLGSAVRHALGVFPDTEPSRYLMTVFLAPLDDGEGFERGATFTLAHSPTAESIMLWGNNLAHELYHLWVGGRIHGTDADDHEWFDEGFTDYYADLALVQGGVITEELFWRKAEKVLARYAYSKFSSLYPPLSLAEASAAKGRHRFGVYDGGWAAAFCLDTMILAASDGERSLDDVMRALFDRFAASGTAFTLETLEAVAGEAARLDLADFFDRYVHGRDQIPTDQCLATVGLADRSQPYAAEMWIVPSPTVGEREHRLRRLIVDHR